MAKSNPCGELLSKDEARELLTPYLADLYLVFTRSWETLEAIYTAVPHLRLSMSPRARANFLSSQFAHNARLLLGNKPGITIKEKRGCVMIDIRGRALIRFKKFDSNLRTRNILTGQQRLISEQSGQQVLFDMPTEATYLTAGYVLDMTATGFRSLFVTCQRGKELVWPLRLVAPPATNIFALPMAASNNSQPGFRLFGPDETEANEGREETETGS